MKKSKLQKLTLNKVSIVDLDTQAKVKGGGDVTLISGCVSCYLECTLYQCPTAPWDCPAPPPRDTIGIPECHPEM